MEKGEELLQAEYYIGKMCLLSEDPESEKVQEIVRAAFKEAIRIMIHRLQFDTTKKIEI